MKWLLFALSLFALWVAFNALFMLPGRYTAFNFELAAAGIVIGIVTAWLSGKRFIDTGHRRGKRGALMQAPPVLLCTFILVIF
jgi:membrane associated rhomboid family serine protease